MEFIEIDGRRVAYEARVAGRQAVIFVHGGFGSSSVLWMETMSRLPDDVSAFAINNFVGSEAPAGGYSVQSFAKRLVDFMAATNLDRPVIVGHSMGGVVCQLACLAAPDRIGGVVLVGSGASTRNHGLAQDLLAQMERDGVSAEQIRTMSAHWFATAPKDFFARYVEQAVTVPGQAIIDVQRSLIKTDLEPRLGDIACPALIVHGRLDTGRLIEHAQTLHHGIRNSELVVIDDSGHSPMVETPEAFDDSFHRFLARVASPAPAL